MIKIVEEKVNDNLSGKYGTVKYKSRSDGLKGTTPVYAGYHLLSSDGKYYPYWAGERSMGSSYSSIESAVSGIDKFITKQQENGKMLFIKPVGSTEVVEESNDSKKYDGVSESYSKNSIYYKVLSKLSTGVAISEIYDQPNIGALFDIEPSDKSINKVISRLESLGFREVDHYEDDSHRNDSYIVFINEIQGERVVCGIVYNAEQNFAFVNADYDEIEDGEYFE